MQILRDNPVLLLFLVAALGQIVGRWQVAGFGLGASAVLFTGLAFGAMDPGFRLPDFVYIFGLSLFVYTMGVSGGPGFFASFRKRALRDNLMVLLILMGGAGLTLGIGQVLHLDAPYTAGLFSGALTNTPALAGILDSLKASGADESLLSAPVVGYSLAYPGGVIGMLLGVYFVFRLSARKKQQDPGGHALAQGEHSLESWVVRVTSPAAVHSTVHDLRQKAHLQVSFARIKRQGQLSIATDETRLELDDLISIIGRKSCLETATQLLGERSDDRLDLDRSRIDFRRIFVSQKSVTEVPLHTLHIGSKFGAAITRVRRGDVDIIPDGNTVLEPGDRVRVVAPRDRMEEISKFLGDSYKALSEIDVITFSIGLALGLLLGKVPLPLPNGGYFELGFAGGPLIVGLILGRLGRTGPFVWTLPFSANLTLRQLGMVLFLAGIGTRSGFSFAATLQKGGGFLPLMLGGAVITCFVAMSMIFVGHYLLKIPAPSLAGMLAGTQTQPAVLAFAVEQSGDESPNTGYATVYPLAMICKIVLAQLILAFL